MTWKRLGYTALTRRVGEDLAFEMRSETGIVYQLEVSILWDGKPGGAIRIIGSIDDGGLRAFLLSLTPGSWNLKAVRFPPRRYRPMITQSD